MKCNLLYFCDYSNFVTMLEVYLLQNKRALKFWYINGFEKYCYETAIATIDSGIVNQSLR